MRTLIRMLCALVLLPAAAAAMPCGACNSSSPACISLVGSNGVVPASDVGSFTVIIRDIANNPIVGANVVIDLSGALDVEICADQLDPGLVVNCAAKTVSHATDANGSVTFTILGGSNGAGNASTLLGGGKIFANGTLIQSPTISAYDLDGSGGVGANDFSAWLGDFGSGLPYGRSDYDCSGTVGVNDLSLWLKAFGSGTMSVSCGASCP
jgi:hypothetical protein